MAISIYPTYGFLHWWMEYNGENIWHFNQLTGAGAYLQDRPVYNREDINFVARAIAPSFMLLARSLRYFPVPIFTNERVRIKNGSPINEQLHTLKWGYVHAIGRRATSLIEAGVTIDYSDVGSLGVFDTAEITVTVSEDIPDDEIRVFFKVSDGAKSAASDLYEITPLTRTRTGTTLTLTGHRALFVKPNGLWSQPWKDPNYMDRNSGDNSNNAVFVEEVDVYRVYPDSTNAVQFIGNTSCSSCGQTTTRGCAEIVESDLGTVRFSPLDCSTCATYPKTMDIYYYAGYPLMDEIPDTTLTLALTRLTNCQMPLQPVAVDNVQRSVWADDRMPAPEGTAPYLLNNPFGLKRGEVEAFREIQSMILGRGKSTSRTWRDAAW